MTIRILLACFAYAAVAHGADLTIAPDGLTAAEALARVRAARAAGDNAPKTIAVRGVNRLVSPIVLTDADHDIAFVGADGAAFSGGLDVTGWREAGDGVWEADAPRLPDGRTMFFDQLWANGRRAPCARFPNEGWLRISFATQTVSRAEGRATLYPEHIVFATPVAKILAAVPKEDWPYLEAGIVCKWCYGLRSPAACDVAKNEVTFETHNSWSDFMHWTSNNTLVAFRNVRSSFDVPGEWFLDMKAGKVRYRPLPGETTATFACTVPRPGLPRLVDIRGDRKNGRFAQRISFRNIAFACTSPVTDRNRPEEIVMLQAASDTDGAVTAEGVREISFENCRFSHTANYALRFNSACMSNRLVNCTIEDAGAGGIWMGADYSEMKADTSVTRRILLPTRANATAFNLISNCTVRSFGRYNREGTGIVLGHCSDSKVVHCDVFDGYYSGISVGWSWGFGGSVAQRNEIAFNRIWDLGKGVMSDMSGIYMLGVSFGTTVHDNVIHDVKIFSYGGRGMYADEGSEGIVFERNLVWNTTNAGFFQHFGSGCIVRNNIFAWTGKDGSIRMYRPEVDGIPCPLHFVNNIVVTREGPLCGKGVRSVGGIWANNLWWDVRGEAAAQFDELTWSGWKTCGKETGSAFADPRFVDAEKFDFRLKPDSPALALGFKPWDCAEAGRK